MPKSESKPAVSTTAEKSGLILAPPRYRNRLTSGGYAQRYSTTVHVWSTAMMEVVVSEILKEAAERCATEKKNTITRYHAYDGIRENPILAELFMDFDMHDVGVADHLSPALLNKPKSRRRRSKKSRVKKTK